MITFSIFLMIFIFAMSLVITNNDDEFSNLIKVFYECRAKYSGTIDTPKSSSKKYRVHYCVGDKEIKRDYGSGLIIPTFKDTVSINGTSYSVMKVVHDADKLDITITLR